VAPPMPTPEPIARVAPKPEPSLSGPVRVLAEPSIARNVLETPGSAMTGRGPRAAAPPAAVPPSPISIFTILVPAKLGIGSVSEDRVADEMALPAAGGLSAPSADARPIIAQPGAAQAQIPASGGQGPTQAAGANKGGESGKLPSAATIAPNKTATPSVSLPAAPPSAAPLVMPGLERKPVTRAPMSAQTGSRIEIPFEGTGWTYLGEKGQKEGVRYDSRRFEGSNLVFVLSASKPGEYLLWFQRQDPLLGTAIDELVPLAVSQKAQAPMAPDQAQTGPSQQPSPAKTPAAAASGSPAAGPGAESPQEIILAARKEIEAGRAQGAVDALTALLARHPSGLDEAFFLMGQALELNGPTRDVQRAYSYYKRIRDEFPHSQFWDRASERMNYIERHFFEIR
jgi:hypothetical protein